MRLERPLILVVDDDNLVRRFVCTVLGLAEFEVVEASNGIQALDLFQTQRANIDLVLTDVVMPGMAGTELARHLTSVDPALPILFMSSYSTTIDSAECISKPFVNSDLIARIRKKLELTGRHPPPAQGASHG